jgi:hypothetical protein
VQKETAPEVRSGWPVDNSRLFPEVPKQRDDVKLYFAYLVIL